MTLSTDISSTPAGPARPPVDGHQHQAEKQQPALRPNKRPSLPQQMNQPGDLSFSACSGCSKPRACAPASVASSAAGVQITVRRADFSDRWHFIIVLHLESEMPTSLTMHQPTLRGAPKTPCQTEPRAASRHSFRTELPISSRLASRSESLAPDSSPGISPGRLRQLPCFCNNNLRYPR